MPSDPFPETPRLSVTLPGPRHLPMCQSCMTTERLTKWLEHDERDRPEPIVVILCQRCARDLIAPHPRLYRELQAWEPTPGSMPLCVNCRFVDDLACTHPKLKANGGPGLILTMPRPTEMHVCRSPRRLSGWIKIYHGPVSACEGRQLDEPPIEEIPT